MTTVLVRDHFNPYVSTFEKDMEDLLGIKWTLEMPWAECLDKAADSGFKQNPGEFAAGYFAVIPFLRAVSVFPCLVATPPEGCSHSAQEHHERRQGRHGR